MRAPLPVGYLPIPYLILSYPAPERSSDLKRYSPDIRANWRSRYSQASTRGNPHGSGVCGRIGHMVVQKEIAPHRKRRLTNPWLSHAGLLYWCKVPASRWKRALAQSGQAGLATRPRCRIGLSALARAQWPTTGGGGQSSFQRCLCAEELMPPEFPRGRSLHAQPLAHVLRPLCRLPHRASLPLRLTALCPRSCAGGDVVGGQVAVDCAESTLLPHRSPLVELHSPAKWGAGRSKSCASITSGTGR